ncbi:hypothetical protein F5050DRAFT_332684 [Lentinula boryana]|uniref:Uncharacterized protein n=1 Tax=Lentinula boryana TaxID=40481 RepID=A0ABQ8QQH1_9AGAR|nr:hypothetical protein F5050DRAFT_332684 [Lentinula boryana]
MKYLPARQSSFFFCLVCKEFNQLGLDILSIQGYSEHQCPLFQHSRLRFSSKSSQNSSRSVALSKETYGGLGCQSCLKSCLIYPSFLRSVLSIRNHYLNAISPISKFFRIQRQSHNPSYPSSRNNSIVSLTFDCCLPLFQNFVLRPIILPQLRYLLGSPQIIQVFAQRAPLETVRISWKYEHARIKVSDDALSFLALYCLTAVRELDI